MLRRLQQSLPKLWLFGLYGALGGLFGALIFGEALWAALSPPSPPPAEASPPLQIAVSPSVSIYRGGQNRFSIQIARHEVVGEVNCKFRGLPSDLTVGPVTIAANASKAEVDVACGPAATLGDSPVVVVGSISKPANDKAAVTAEAEIKFTILQPEPRPEIRLSASESVVVEQSRSNRFTVKIARDDFTGPVKVEVHSNTPGITCPAVTIPANATEIELEVGADAHAKVGVENAKILVHGPMEGGLPSSESSIKLTVSTFTSPPAPQVDIMFALDVTSSTQAAIDGVREGIQDFAKQLEAKKLDARIGLVAFRDLFEEEPAQLLRFGGETFTKDYAEFRRQVGDLEADGGGDVPESSLDCQSTASRTAASVGSSQESTRQTGHYNRSRGRGASSQGCSI